MAVIPGQAVTAYPLPDEELSPTSKNAVSNEAVCEGLNEIKNTLDHKADAIYDTASGDIASFPDGADGLPVKDLTVAIEPVQSGTGDPSPTNVRPISGWTGCNISHSGADTSDPTVIPITFPASAGTVYGGTLDVTSGVLTVDMAGVDMGTLEWSTYVYADTYRHYATVTGMKSTGDVQSEWIAGIICSIYKPDIRVITGTPVEDAIARYGSSSKIYIIDGSYTDAATFKAAMSGVQLVYVLATPLVYNLTPTEVTTLLGQNNVWTDCGPSTVEYPCDTKLYIQKINAPSDDDMIADANIASGKYFIVNNNLYLSTTAILAGDPIKPGTNCTLTNLAAALNAINS